MDLVENGTSSSSAPSSPHPTPPTDRVSTRAASKRKKQTITKEPRVERR